jgi:hypothetical protein
MDCPDGGSTNPLSFVSAVLSLGRVLVHVFVTDFYHLGVIDDHLERVFDLYVHFAHVDLCFYSACQ